MARFLIKGQYVDHKDLHTVLKEIFALREQCIPLEAKNEETVSNLVSLIGTKLDMGRITFISRVNGRVEATVSRDGKLYRLWLSELVIEVLLQ